MFSKQCCCYFNTFITQKKDIMLRILFINYSSMVSVKNNISCLGGTWLVPFYYRRLYPQQEDHQYWCCKILHKFLFPLNTYSSSTNNCQGKKWRFHLWIINVLIRLSTEFNVEWKKCACNVLITIGKDGWSDCDQYNSQKHNVSWGSISSPN